MMGFSDLWIISSAVLEHSYLFVLKMVQMDPKQGKCPMKIFLLFFKIFILHLLAIESHILLQGDNLLFTYLYNFFRIYIKTKYFCFCLARLKILNVDFTTVDINSLSEI